MDPNLLVHQIMPLLGVVVLFVGLRWVLRTPVGEALAERIRQGSRRRRHWKGFGGEWLDVPEGEGAGVADERRVAALEQQLVELQGQVSELAERLDFAERLLAERRERRLPAGP